MKAITLKNFGGVENFELVEVDDPKLKDNEVLVKIKATTFNPIDYQMRQGSTESKLLKSPILGREFSGEIMQLGKNINTFDIGDKVSAYVGSLGSNGTYAELISAPAELLAKTPSQLTFAEATAIPMVGMTALQCFNRLAIPKEKPIFISGGAGGVGTVFIKLLIANGNTNIYTTAGNDESIHHLKSLGVNSNNIINYKNQDIVKVLSNKVGSFEYIIDLVGGNMSETCAELIDIFGTYVDITFLATVKAKETLFDKATQIINVANYAPTLKENSENLEYYGKMLKELFNKIEKDIISPTAIKTVGSLSVETVKKAHQLMENNQVRGKKLVMTV